MDNDYTIQDDESWHNHCTNERGVGNWDKKVRRDVI